MGHTRVGVLPATRKWESVRDLLDANESAAVVADQTLRNVADLLGDADREKYGRLAREEGVVLSFWLLMTLPSLARTAAPFKDALREVAIELPAEAWASSVAFIALVTRRLERRVERAPTTFTSIAFAALRETLTSRLGRSAGALFDSSEQEIKRVWSEYGTATRFGDLAQDYLGTFLERLTQFYVSRETPQHLGTDDRFKTLNDVDDFDRALKVWSRERAAIARQFASQWLSKETYEHGRPTPNDAQNFVSYALAKVGSEVRAHSPEQ